MNTKYVIGNWKENPNDLKTAKELIKITENFLNKNGELKVAITHAVPSIFVGFLAEEATRESKVPNIILQNISAYESGSHTGEISATQAKSLGIGMSLVGHSETRLSPENPHGDEDKNVNQKVLNLIKENMWICLCVGEYKRGGGDEYQNTIKQQIENCLQGVADKHLEKIVLAYEPVWAIGKSATRAATNEEIFDTVSFIKDVLKNTYKEKNIGENIKVLYGGSVDEKNAKDILKISCVDGLLIGRASCDPTKWQALLESLK